jgi:Family of unknown function (DUF6843)
VTRVAVVLGLLFALGCGGPKVAWTWVVPDGFDGWVTVQWGVDGAPPLPAVDGRQVGTIPPDGRLATSSPFVAGILDQRVVTRSGQALPWLDQETRCAGAECTDHTAATPFFCCGSTFVDNADGNSRTWWTFYVGKGPAGIPDAP